MYLSSLALAKSCIILTSTTERIKSIALFIHMVASCEQISMALSYR